MLDTLRQRSVVSGQAGVKFFGLSADKIKLVEDYAERLRDDDLSLPENETSRQLREDVARLQEEVNNHRVRYANVAIELDETRQKLLHFSQDRHEQVVFSPSHRQRLSTCL